MLLGYIPDVASLLAALPRRPSDAEFSALAAEAYPELLDRETGRPWWDVALARRDAEIAALKARIVELEADPTVK